MTASRDTVVPVVKSCGDPVSNIIAGTKRFRIAKERKPHFVTVPLFQGRNKVDATVRNWTPEIDEAIPFLSYSMLQMLSKLIFNNLLYSLRHAWPELDEFFSDSPISLGVCYAFRVHCKTFDYLTTTTAVGGSDSTGWRRKRGDATRLAFSVNSMLEKSVVASIRSWIVQTQSRCEAT